MVRPSTLLVALVVLACFASDAWACPTCKEDLANDPQGRGLATGFYYSILPVSYTHLTLPTIYSV